MTISGHAHMTNITLLLIHLLNSHTPLCATERFVFELLVVDVSTHAPTWGATQDAEQHRQGYRFQFTHPHGVRLPHFKMASLQVVKPYISRRYKMGESLALYLGLNIVN